MRETPEMVERVRRALDHALGAKTAVKIDTAFLARAAIQTMREPTEAMMKTGVKFTLGASLSGDYRWPDYIADMHRLQIDAALASPAEGREP